MALYTAIEACRACGSDQLTQALDLGLFMLSDFRSMPDTETVDDFAPLTLLRCDDCTLVQLQHTVKRERLYANYWYRSSTQPAMVAALQDVVRDATSRIPIHAGDVVVDIGANDGTLLAQYPEGTIKLAYEPALNLWAPLVESGATVVGGFFPPDRAVAYRKAKVVTSIACFYDCDDPGAFVEGIKRILADDGIWVNQMAYFPETLRTNNFGDICHEHLTYWDQRSFGELLAEHGMHAESHSYNDVNGGSIRTVIRHGAPENLGAWVPVVGLLAIRRFDQRIKLHRSSVRSFLHEAKRDGHMVIGYGASTKGNTYLQYWGVGPELIELIADRNPNKWDKFTPTGQRIISEERMREAAPEYLLMLPWHFAEAFIEREADLLKHGTEFVIPFPNLSLVGGAHASSESSPTPAALGAAQA